MDESLEERFQRAAERMTKNRNLKLTDKQKLELYGLFKQAKDGDCNTQRPGWFDFTAKAKWDSWHEVIGMSSSDAMGKYITAVGILDPDWETTYLNPLNPSAEQPQDESNTGGHAVSTLAGMDAEESLADDKKTLFDWCKEGDMKKLRALVTESNVNQTDDQGMGLLHWACDRGNLEVVKLVVDKGADVNIQDRDKQTPLHYAASCDHGNIVQYLLQTAHADKTIRDCSDDLPEDVITNDSTRELFQT